MEAITIKRGAVYIRVSTDEQREFSPAAQLKAIEKYAVNNDIEINEGFIYRDEGISGRKAEKRPAFMKMISDARKHKGCERQFDIILVHKLDRFSRSREESIVYKSLLRRECGISVVSVTEPIAEDKFSIILEAMLEAMAEYYSLNLSDEVKKGMREKAERGGYMTSAPFGYKWQENVLVRNYDEEIYVRYIFESFLSGMSKRRIAENLNDMGILTHRGNRFEIRTIDYILKNPVYAGFTRWNPYKRQNYRQKADESTIIRKGRHEAIISEGDFERVKNMNESAVSNYKRYRDIKPVHWLGGIIRCGSCGSSLCVSLSSKSLQCTGYSHGKCSISHYIKLKTAENAVINEIGRLIKLQCKSFVFLNDGGDTEYKAEITALKKQKARLERINEAYICGIYDADYYRNKRTEEENKLESIKKNIKAINERKDGKKIYVSSFYDIIEGGIFDNEYIAHTLYSVVNKIIYCKERQCFIFYYRL